MDEMSISSNSIIYKISGSSIKEEIITPKELGINTEIPIGSIKGGNACENAKIIRSVLARVEGPAMATVVLNSAAALLVAGAVNNLEEGFMKAALSIEEGRATKVLEEVIRISNF